MVLQLVLPQADADNIKQEPPITPKYIHYGKNFILSVPRLDSYLRLSHGVPHITSQIIFGQTKKKTFFFSLDGSDCLTSSHSELVLKLRIPLDRGAPRRKRPLPTQGNIL
jgi:hypothetical protein